MTWFRRLYDLRQDADKRQVDMAGILGIDAFSYGRYERGEREIPLRHLIALADYYNVSVDYILGRVDQNSGWRNSKLHCNGGKDRMKGYCRIAELRKGAGKMQKEIASLLTMSPQQYSRYERGEREIPVHHLITLADYYQVSVDYIVDRTDVKA